MSNKDGSHSFVVFYCFIKHVVWFYDFNTITLFVKIDIAGAPCGKKFHFTFVIFIMNCVTMGLMLFFRLTTFWKVVRHDGIIIVPLVEGDARIGSAGVKLPPYLNLLIFYCLYLSFLFILFFKHHLKILSFSNLSILIEIFSS